MFDGSIYHFSKAIKLLMATEFNTTGKGAQWHLECHCGIVHDLIYLYPPPPIFQQDASFSTLFLAKGGNYLDGPF